MYQQSIKGSVAEAAKEDGHDIKDTAVKAVKDAEQKVKELIK